MLEALFMDLLSEHLETPKRGSFDVIVCGGGIAGTAAAVSAARLGAQVLLVEKSVCLGGLATNGLISFYEPICDGRGRKRMYGIASELLRLAVRYGPDDLSPEWRSDPDTAECPKRYCAVFSPGIFTAVLDRWVLESGVSLLLDSSAVLPVMEGNICRGVAVENKSGRGFYEAKAVVDATGDSDLFFRAGAPCAEAENYLCYSAYLSDRDSCRKAADSGNLLSARRWLSLGGDRLGRGHPEGAPHLTGVTAEDVTEFVVRGRRLLLEKVEGEEKGSLDVTAVPSMAQLRTTRRICGEYTLTEADEGRHFEDSIGVAVDFFNRGRVYELPWRILLRRDYPNLFTAGRTVSSEGWAWEVTRVIPVCAATGEAAGAAAAFLARDPGRSPSVPLLQKELESRGVMLRL